MTNNVTPLAIAVKIGPFKNFGDFRITNSLKFGFSLFCRVLLLALFFFVPVFTSCSFVCFVFFNRYLQLRSVELFSATDNKYHYKKPIMQLNKVHHGKCHQQNRNKMGEDRQRKLTANHQHFNNLS